MDSTAYECEKIDPWYWRYSSKNTDEAFLQSMVKPAIEHFAANNFKTAIILKYNDGTMLVHAIALCQKGNKAKSERAQHQFQDDLQVSQISESNWTPTQLSFDK